MVSGDLYPAIFKDNQIQNKKNWFENAIIKSFGDSSGLKQCKTLINRRSYVLFEEAASPEEPAQNTYTELQIPIAETFRNLNLLPSGFTIGEDNEIYPYSELGTWVGETAFEPPVNSAEAILNSSDNLKGLLHLTKNSHQFFYNNLASDLLSDLKNTPEFRLMYEYIFPMRRYMSTAFLYAAEGISRFIPEPTDVLQQTKKTALNYLTSVLNSDDYNFRPPAVANQLENFIASADKGTTGQESNLGSQILEIILKTPLLILKGFVEVTDPAIMIGKAIITAVITANQAILGAIESTHKATKSSIEESKNIATNTVMQISVQAPMLANPAKVTYDTLDEEVKVFATGFDTIDNDLPEWDLKINTEWLPGANVSQDTLAKIDALKITIDEINEMQEEYVSTQEEIKNLEDDLKDINKKLEDVGKQMKAITDGLESPYALPALWAAMLPSMTPYGGGIIPPPFFVGPPSTVPGMIYLALLLMDIYEENVHDEATKEGLNCEEEL